MCSVVHSRKLILIELLDYPKIDVDYKSGGLAALHVACSQGDEESTALLLLSGADPNQKGDDGKSPKDVARGDKKILNS